MRKFSLLVLLAAIGAATALFLASPVQQAKSDRAGFLAQQVRSETGIGASGASGH